MITAMHALLYADDPDAARDFFRDVLGWPHVDAGGGWLIFRSGPSELALHPAGSSGPQHEISFMCDDLDATIRDLAAKGARFSGGIDEQRWGRLTKLEVPGAGAVLLYEPKHPPGHSLPA
ncbi:VOC family protein [Aldersonia sp. NBC_00410]|uniref:VOC family protein n=1 Tax=Aldersonia sp. NBC_00410 TaxID=2975954 RepID=UPI00225340BE|nr:VOC family protein [Aldersonia sp. NBC_00410]MCX5043047.1 VOC family protein [Aldersonia sp. NBC_00410]